MADLPAVPGFAYDQAVALVADLVAVDDVQKLDALADKVREYARRASNRDLELNAAEVRLRCKRRLGELLVDLPLNKGGRTGGTGPKLADYGLSKFQSSEAQRLARLPEDRFETEIGRWRDYQGKEAQRVSMRLVTGFDKAEHRARREADLAGQIEALPSRRFGIIYADPEWRYQTRSDAGKDRSADNHYPTSPLADIQLRGVGDLAADDCILFMWATVPMLWEAFCVLDAWGFAPFDRDAESGLLTPRRKAGAQQYVSALAWVKDRGNAHGMGHWFRVDHELLLVATKGKPIAPADGSQIPSVLTTPYDGVHSAKPDEIRQMIDRLWPATPKIVLNHRGAPWPGWTCWGNEAINNGEGD